MNDQPVYTNVEGYFLWTNDPLKITISLVRINGQAQVGKKRPWPLTNARYSPDEEYAKQAMFRLAVAFQGSQDNENAIRLFQQFVTLFPDDKFVSVYLHMILRPVKVSIPSQISNKFVKPVRVMPRYEKTHKRLV